MTIRRGEVTLRSLEIERIEPSCRIISLASTTTPGEAKERERDMRTKRCFKRVLASERRKESERGKERERDWR